ncbi:DNA topoisomerase VI subunit B [Sulfolobus acidocaldarius]|uniref:Type 2 DNA topoisomerase 6 subunit B n=4 Tax=Sulfolobus acidocaldarius TaxID=2285 RepID=Q4J979_SULAC|nr:DNA topoisomerase VI subunit B [Sulfolobus acidocaldarius]AAY80651.1 DNA topoisomerase VI subunit B [Sulfolobus acidocaldarius DSM 639]AGE71247.1 DNA topoisomerase VI subunit B [Sulfolobus acidocaldarius N8]AGE73516.1 DNA topoisomerase VI subunit B [Sulfolobus acidocaldarius Ron12/I]ALU30488.1 DNA topoisomerase VI [Sulfolobus acidocaldarius]ALU31211.1 DNA topoisomerase VI [Sulfolobus acidocaldarius]
MPQEEKYSSISPAEFFKRNPELAGFSNPARALYQTVRELIENALDATDVHNLLPSLKISIELVDQQKQIYKVNVEDNGIGIPPHVVPNAFGKVLYSSKYVLRQTRGMYGLGVKAAVLYSQMYQDKPLEIYTSPLNSKRIYFFRLKIDVTKNEPVIMERYSISNDKGWHGTSVSIYLLADWQRSKAKVYEYVKRTYIIAPYSEIVFRDPEGNVLYFQRLTTKLPKPPEEVKPHPYGVDIELIKFMIAKIDKPLDIRDFLVKEFQSVGDVTADKILELSKISKNKKITNLTDEEISRLVEVMKTFDDFRPPSAEALSVIGSDLIELSLQKVFNPEFVSAITRRPKAYQGHPFIVEAGVAYGGGIPAATEPLVLRYANKIPLIYDEKSDVIWKVISEEIDWKRYGVETDQYQLVVMVHLCSTKVPYKSAGKESIADVEEIEKEIKLAIMDVARNLKKYLTEKRKEQEAKKKLITYLKYIPEVSRSLSMFVAGSKEKIPDTDKVLRSRLLDLIIRRLEIEDKNLEEEIKKYKVEEV